MTPQIIGVNVGSKIPNILRSSIKNAVKTGKYLNTSDFVRHAIKEKLDREGFLWCAARAEEPLMEN
jgi:Arc/MetJ-type ribon-helix-helix transcriptional regulator